MIQHSEDSEDHNLRRVSQDIEFDLLQDTCLNPQEKDLLDQKSQFSNIFLAKFLPIPHLMIHLHSSCISSCRFIAYHRLNCALYSYSVYFLKLSIGNLKKHQGAHEYS